MKFVSTPVTKEDQDKIREVVEFLHKYEEGEDSADQLYAAAVHGLKLQRFREEHQVTEVDPQPKLFQNWDSFKLLLPHEQRETFVEAFPSALFYPNYMTIWRTRWSDQIVCVTFAPFRLYSQEIVGLGRFYIEFALGVKICQKSGWDYPGATNHVEVWAPGFCPSHEEQVKRDAENAVLATFEQKGGTL